MTDAPVLDAAARSAIWGVSGSGKSTLAARIAASWASARAVVIIDPTGPHHPALPPDWKPRPGLTALSPSTPDQCTAALLTAYLVSHRTTPVTVICDEAPFFLAKPSEAVLKVVYQGRHRGLGMVLVGQRPSAVAPGVRSQVTRTIYMKLTDRADLNIVAASSRQLAADLPGLDVGEWRQWPK
ncbi:helicase HerA domain-containing protein [Ruegeria sp.]|uniref:helicase HerA domain-containing protein n=1 Tax=Ruegeria sp. TaxID=1879320 RepID=UPI003C7E8518